AVMARVGLPIGKTYIDRIIRDAGYKFVKARAKLTSNDPDFRGGVSVAVGDVTGDGVADIVTGTGVGGGPQVEVFDGRSGAVVRSFFAYESSFRDGVTVAVGDVEGDGRADVVTGPGPGGGALVELFEGAASQPVGRFLTRDPAFRRGGARAA